MQTKTANTRTFNGGGTEGDDEPSFADLEALYGAHTGPETGPGHMCPKDIAMNMNRQHWLSSNGLNGVEKRAGTFSEHLRCLDEHIDRLKGKLADGPPKTLMHGTPFDIDGFWMARWIRVCAKTATEIFGSDRVGMVYHNEALNEGPVLVLSNAWYCNGPHLLEDFDITFYAGVEGLREELDAYGLKPPKTFVRGTGLIEGP